MTGIVSIVVATALITVICNVLLDYTEISRGKWTKEPQIVVKGLDMGYGSFILMQNLNFTVNRGDIFIIMGGTGCGKSTLLKILVGLKRALRGRCLYGGMSFWDADPDEQGAYDEAIRHPLPERGPLEFDDPGRECRPSPGTVHRPESRPDQGDRLLEACPGRPRGFEEFYPSEISGGMRKRAGLARAMALDPDILFFDEPSAGLDPVSARLLDDLILELRESLGTTFVVVTHELASIFAIGNNSVYLDVDSRTMTASGDPKKLLAESTDPRFVVSHAGRRRGTARKAIIPVEGESS